MRGKSLGQEKQTELMKTSIEGEMRVEAMEMSAGLKHSLCNVCFLLDLNRKHDIIIKVALC